MDVDAFLESLKSDPDYQDQIVHVHAEPAREPVWAPLPEGLHAGVRGFLEGLGVSRVYRHQAEAIAAALRGEDVLITTGPASGKSLCFQVPILQRFLEEPTSTALFVFPMKALARDQVASWNRGVKAMRGSTGSPRPQPAEGREGGGVQAMPFDADASTADRRTARDRARLLVTNPEMLHCRLLPGHGGWARFFQGLRYVVLDELHVYAGFFGANMANVVRRLERVCRHYGATPQFICSSATVGNPKDMAEKVVGRPLHHVADDASAMGSRTYVFWNPPRIRRRRWRGRRSANVEAHELMVKLIRQRAPTICFAKSRTTAEMMYRYVREGLQREAPGLADKVVPYRGGYSPKQRRDMERRLREGELLGVSATRALELGIDVGALDACIIIGYPGWLHSLFQQWGRAGRAGRDCLCILVGTDTPINQYVMQHPEFIFERPVESGVVDRDNPFVVLGHVRAATAELPVQAAETARFGYAAGLALEVLEEKEKVRRIADAWYHASPDPPAHEVRLRGYGDESTVIHDADTDEVLDRIDKFRALRIFYPGAIYLRGGNTYAMVHHDFDRNIVRVRRVSVDYYTDPLTGTAVDHIDVDLDQRPCGIGTAHLGEVYAVLSTFCYERVRFYSVERIDQQPADVPNVAYEAMSFWLTAPEQLAREAVARGLDAYDGMRGILYCVSRVLPLFLTSDANDFDWSLGCINASPETMFWYEFYLKGIGHSEQCYERLEEILAVALEQLLTCDCDDGCPNCTSRPITPYHVRNVELGEGTSHSRRAAAVVLNSLLAGQPVDASIALLDADRPRGQRFLPYVQARPRLVTPHHMPLDLRTRRLLARKLDRQRLPHLPVGHAVEPIPPEGIPDREPDATASASDSEARSGHPAIRRGPSSSASPSAIRRTGDKTARNALRRLKPKPKDSPPPEPPAPAAPPPPPPPAESPPPAPIKAGDRLAALARKRKRRRPRNAGDAGAAPTDP